jgi:hypothetical protein
MSLETDVAAVRVALLDAIGRERPRRRGRWIAGAVAVALLGSAGAAAASGMLFAPPKVDHSVPAVAEWTYFAENPYGGGGPVLLRRHPDATARINRENEAALGNGARCGIDSDHPTACFSPAGDLLIPPVMGDDRASDYDVKPLTPDEAHAWLCAHPEQRPGADFGEKPPPPMEC